MTEHTVALDNHRGMAAQKATELRRLVAEVAADQASLKERQDALEQQLISAPASGWPEVAEKTRYLLTLFAATTEGQDSRRKQLIANLLDDFERLLPPAVDGDQEHTGTSHNQDA